MFKSFVYLLQPSPSLTCTLLMLLHCYLVSDTMLQTHKHTHSWVISFFITKCLSLKNGPPSGTSKAFHRRFSATIHPSVKPRPGGNRNAKHALCMQISICGRRNGGTFSMTQPAGSSEGGSKVGRQALEQCTQEHARGPLLAHTGVTATFTKTECNYWSLEFPCPASLAENVTS